MIQLQQEVQQGKSLDTNRVVTSAMDMPGQL